MDSASRRRLGGRPRTPDLGLMASLILLHAAWATLPTAHGGAVPGPALGRRLEGEHVVLADCRDRRGTVSSQMAYFPGEPGPEPADVAVVVTRPGQAALWVNGNTSALFTDTGVTFTASLGPKVDEGRFAGVGDNGYGSFGCWQRYVPQLYVYESTVCSQVYECDHSPPPEGWSLATVTSREDGSLARGTTIGIVVAVVGTALFAVAAAVVFWFWRRWRREQRSAAAKSSSSSSSSSSSPPEEGASPAKDSRAPSEEEVDGAAEPAATTHEMDGRRFRVEMDTDHGKHEMDGQGRVELPGDGETCEMRETRAAVSPPPLSKGGQEEGSRAASPGSLHGVGDEPPPAYTTRRLM